MESGILPTTDNSCEELYSDIKADSFDVLTGECYDLNTSLPLNHHSFNSVDLACSFENTAGAIRFQSLDTEVIEDLESICLNVESGGQENSSLTVVNDSSNKQEDLSFPAVYSDSDRPESSNLSVFSDNDKQESLGLEVYGDNNKQEKSAFVFCVQSGKQKNSGLSSVYANVEYPNLKIPKAAVDSNEGHTKQEEDEIIQSLVGFEKDDTLRISARSKQDDTTLNNFDSKSKDFNVNFKSDKTKCQEDDNDNQGALSSWVKTVKAENEALQMFLVDDPDICFDIDNPCNNSLQLKTNTNYQNSIFEKLHAHNQKEMKKNEKLTENTSVQNETEGNESLKNKNRIGHLCEEATYCNTPSRRSLRLKFDKRSTASFRYKINSDNENFIDTENEVLTLNTLINETSRNYKSKSVLNDSATKGKPYTCDVCSVMCKTAYNLRQHKQTHNASKLTVCKQCNYSCKKKSDMRKHEETHGPQNMYKCMECDYSGKRLRYLKKHMRIHSKDSSFSCHLCEYRSINKAAFDSHLCQHSLKVYECKDCGDSFKHKSSLNKHIVSHSNSSLFTCNLCMKFFISKKLLEKHKAGHNEGFQINKNVTVDETDSNVDEDCNRISENDGSNAYEDCNRVTECDVSNADDSDIKITNVNINTADFSKSVSKKPKILGTYGFLKMKSGPIQCTLCSYSCTSKSVLGRHMRRHSDSKPYVCPQCGASFKRKDHLKVHRLTHSNILPYKCPHCLYGTHRKYRLTLHILTHQTLKPIKCSLCAYSCRRDCELRYHMRNKHGRDLELKTKPRTDGSGVENVVLKCELCNYTCDSQKRLKYHMTRHENKTPHSCPHCEYKCSSRSSLTDHLLQHAGIKPCLCSFCGMSFRNTSRLNRHKLVHSDVKPHGCSFCDFSSRSKYNLKQHVLRHTDESRARRRSKNPLNIKSSNFNCAEAEAIKQIIQPDVQPVVDQADSLLLLNDTKIQRDGTQTSQELKNSSKLMESFQPVPIPQYFNINHMGITNDHNKHQDRNVDLSSCSYNNVYQSASMNPYLIDKSSCPSALTTTPAYSDPYQNSNPFLVHPHQMPYDTNTGHPNFCYTDRSGYEFTNSYFYNETVFPRNINTNINFYMCSSSNSPYAPNSNPVMPINQNLVHLNDQINQTVQLNPISSSTPLISAAENQNQPYIETEDFHTRSLAVSEDISLDGQESQGNVIPKPLQSKSQAKKTGATLNSSKVIVKYKDIENNARLTHVCSECGYICLTNTMLQRHKTTHVDFKPHKCEDCGKSFKRMDHMKAHKRTHNQNKPYSCKHCTYTCSRKYRLKLHEMTHENEQKYSCNVCERIFDSHIDYEEHNRAHYETFTFACNRCDFKCEEKTELRFHHETHNTFLCEECSYVCRSRREFNSHKRMHAGKVELTCSLCSYKCDSQKRLKYHMERHKNKTPHGCPHCDYKCSSRSSLTDHLLQHEGLKPFLCSVCGMRFRNISRLNRHKMTHTDIKPHSCEYCAFSSRSRYNLKQHMLRHFK